MVWTYNLRGGALLSRPFSEWLYARRKDAGLTQQELADRVGCSKSYVSTLERGATHSQSGGELRPSEEIVDLIAKALGVELAEARELAGYAVPPKGDMLFEADLLRKLNRIPVQKQPAAKQAVLAVLEGMATVAA